MPIVVETNWHIWDKNMSDVQLARGKYAPNTKNKNDKKSDLDSARGIYAPSYRNLVRDEEVKSVINNTSILSNNIGNINDINNTIIKSAGDIETVKALAGNKAAVSDYLARAKSLRSQYSDDDEYAKSLDTTIKYLDNIGNLLDSTTKGGSLLANAMFSDAKNRTQNAQNIQRSTLMGAGNAYLASKDTDTQTAKGLYNMYYDNLMKSKYGEMDVKRLIDARKNNKQSMTDDNRFEKTRENKWLDDYIDNIATEDNNIIIDDKQNEIDDKVKKRNNIGVTLSPYDSRNYADKTGLGKSDYDTYNKKAKLNEEIEELQDQKIEARNKQLDKIIARMGSDAQNVRDEYNQEIVFGDEEKEAQINHLMEKDGLSRENATREVENNIKASDRYKQLSDEQISSMVSGIEEKYDLTHEDAADVVYRIMSVENQKKSDAIYEEAYNEDGSTVGKSAKSVLYNLAGSIPQGADVLLQHIGNAVSRNRRPVDTTRIFPAAQKTQGLRDSVASEIDSNVGKFLYNTGMSLADYGAILATSMATMGVGAAAGAGRTTLQASMKAASPMVLTQFGASSGTTTYVDAKKNGASDNEALALGVIAAAAEVVFEKVSLDKLIKGVNPDRAYKIVFNALPQAGIEGTEELNTELANIIAEHVVLGDKSEYVKQYNKLIEQGYTDKEANKEVAKSAGMRVAQSFLGGALSGGVMGLGGGAIGYATNSNYRNMAKYGQNVIDNNGVADVQKFIENNYDKDSEIYKLMENTDMEDAASVGYLLTSAMSSELQLGDTANQEAVIPAIEQRLEELGVEEQNREIIANEVWQNVNSRKKTSPVSKIGKQNINVINQVSEELQNKSDTQQEWVNNIDRNISSKHYGNVRILAEMTQKESFDNKVDNSIKENIKSDMDVKTEEGYVTNGRAHLINDADNKFNITTLVVNKEGKTIAAVKTDDGKYTQYDMDDVVADKDVVELYLYGKEYQPEQRQSFFMAYDEGGRMGSVDNFAYAFNNVYNYGVKNLGIQSALQDENIAFHLTDKQIELAYEAGKQVYNESVKNRTAEIRKVKNSKNGVVTFDKVNEKNLNKTQKAAVDVARALSKVTGVKYEFFSSTTDENGKYAGENGSYNPDTNTIRVDINAGMLSENEGNNIMVVTLAHELTHYIEDFSPSEYAKLQEFAFNKLASKTVMDINEIISREKEKIKKDRKSNGLSELSEKKLEETAKSEITARSFEIMLTDKNAIRELANKDKGLFVKLRDKILEFVEKIETACREILNRDGSYKEGTISQEARLLQEYAKEMRELWSAALEDAGENVKSNFKNQKTTGIKLQDRNSYPYNEQTVIQEYLDSVDDKIKNDYERVVAGDSKFKRNYISDVTSRQIQDFKNIVGVDITGYTNNINTNAYKHINERHGIEGTHDSTMAKSEDVARMKYIIEKYDNAELVTKNDSDEIEYSSEFRDSKDNPAKMIKLSKKINGTHYVVITAADNRYRKLWVVSTYIKKRVTQALDVQAPRPNVRNALASPLGVSISNNSENSNEKFQLRQSQEETKDLIAVHNLSEETLMKALNRGGFPMPSIAVIKGKDGHASFGELSVVFYKDTIDPAKGKNKIYSEDAWTPTQTKLKKNAVFNEVETKKMLNSIKANIGNKYASTLFADSVEKFESTIRKADGSIYDAYAHNLGMQTSYALSNELISEIPSDNGKIDTKLLKSQLSKTLDTDEGWRTYKAWLSQVSDTIIESYDMPTNEDFLKNMAKQPETAKPFKLSANGTLVVPAVEYNSLQETKNNESRLSQDPSDAFKKTGDQFINLANRIRRTSGSSLHTVVESINKSFKGRKSISNIQNTFAKNNINITKSQAIELQNLYKQAIDLPTKYFEAKPQRAVGFDEVAYVVLPDNVSAELKEELANRNISFAEYEADNNESRIEALNSNENVLFQNRGIDEAEVVKDDKGNDIVLLPDRMFSRRKVSNRNEYKKIRENVEQALKQLSGTSIVVKDNQKTINFDDKFADEYTHSNDTMNMNNNIRGAKMNSANAMISLVENAKFRLHSNLTKNKIRVDATGGFDYYTVRFGLPMENGAYTIYSGILNVRIDKANKSYAYDITKISADYETRIKRAGKKSLSADNNIKSQNNSEVKDYVESNNVLKQNRNNSKDSTGKNLTVQQQEFFKDSKVRDESGRLLVVYHGTVDGGFNIFDRKQSYHTDRDTGANWFSSNREMVERNYYSDNSSSSNGKQVYEVYLNMCNPLIVEGYGKPWNKIDLPTELQNKGINKYYNYLEKTTIDSSNASTEQIAKYAKKNEYDGVIFKEIRDGNLKESISDIYAVFDSKQIKNITNENPTEDLDIRYQNRNSDSLEAYKEVLNNSEKYKKDDSLKSTEELESLARNIEQRRGIKFDHYYSIGKLPKIYQDLLDLGEKNLVLIPTHAYANMVTEEQAENDNTFRKATNYHKLGYKKWTRLLKKITDPIAIYDNNRETSKPRLAIQLTDRWSAIIELYSNARTTDGSSRDNHSTITIFPVDTNDYYKDFNCLYKKSSLKTEVSKAISPGDMNSLNSYAENIAQFKDKINYYVESNNVLKQNRNTSPKLYEGALTDSVEYAKAIDYQNQILENVGISKVSDRGIDRLTNKLIKETRTVLSKDEIKTSVKAVFDKAADEQMSRAQIVDELKSITYRALNEKKSDLKRTDYAQGILDELKNIRIRLTEDQALAVYRTTGLKFEDWRKSMFGKVFVVNSGTGVALDTKWQELSRLYPDTFDENVAVEDMPAELETAVFNLSNDYANDWGFDFEDSALYSATEVLAEYGRLPEVKNKVDMSNLEAQQEEYDKQLGKVRVEYLNRIKEFRKGQVQDLRNAKKQWLEERRDREQQLKIRYENLMNQRVANIKNREDSVWTTRDKEKLRNGIIRTVKRLNTMVVNPTNQKHAPQGFLKKTAEFCQLFMNDTSVFSNSALDDLKVAYAALNTKIMDENGNEVSYVLQGQYDVDVEHMIDTLRDTIAGKRLSQLTVSELKTVRDIVEHFDTIIKNENEIELNGRRQSIETVSHDMLNELEDKGQYGEYLEHGEGIKEALYNNLTPVYFFKRLGRTSEKLFNDVLRGQDKAGKNIHKARAFMMETKEKYHYDKWNHKATVEIGDGIELNAEQALYIYATNNREKKNIRQNAHHLTKGGIVLEEKVKWKDKKHLNIDKKITQQRSYHVNAADLVKIGSFLTSEQKAYADAVVDYLSNNMAELGNETSMQLYGLKKYDESYYFPYKTVDSYVEHSATAHQDVESSLLSKSFSKSLTDEAASPIVVGEFTKTAGQHINDMITYNALAVAQDNMNKVFNYVEILRDEETGKKTGVGASVKQMLAGTHGDKAVNYFKNFIVALNGGVKADPMENIYSKMLSRFKKAKTYMSASVVVQQPSSLCRAFAIINPKYFNGIKISSKHWEECKKYNGVAVVKEMGGYDTGLGAGTTDYIVGRRTENLFEMIEEKVDNSKLAKLPGKMDEIAWCTIWNAVKNETKDIGGYAGNEPEFFEKASIRFDEIINKTQVYDSVMSKSSHMRSKSTMAKMVTAFMAEPTVSYNMLVDGLRGGTGAKYGARVLGSLTLNIVTNALLYSLVAAARNDRDEDEDKSYMEKYAKAFAGKAIGVKPYFSGEWNPLTWIPFVRDITNLLDGYDVERTDISLISDMLDSLGDLSELSQELIKSVRDEDYQVDYSVVQDGLLGFASSVSAFTGIPVTNVIRDVKAAMNLGRDFVNDNLIPAEKGKLFSNVWDSLMEGMGFESNDTDRINDYLKGDKAVLDEMLKDAEKAASRKHPDYPEDKIKKEARSGVRTKVTRVLKDNYFAGDTSKDDTIKQMKESGLYLDDKGKDDSKDIFTSWEIAELKKQYLEVAYGSDSFEARKEIRKKLYQTKHWKSLSDLDKQLKSWREQ